MYIRVQYVMDIYCGLMGALYYLMYNDIHVMLFQVGCLEGVLMVCWACAWSIHCVLVLIFLSTSLTWKFIFVMSSFDQGQAGKELQLPSCTYPPQQHHKNLPPHNSLNTNITQDSEMNLKFLCRQNSTA